MAVYGVAQDLGAINAKRFGPLLDGGGVVVGHPEAQHRHTSKSIVYDKDAGNRSPRWNRAKLGSAAVLYGKPHELTAPWGLQRVEDPSSTVAPPEGREVKAVVNAAARSVAGRAWR